MTISFRPVIVAGESEREGAGRLVFEDDRLVAVLVQLSAIQGEAAGRWFLEAGFGELQGPVFPTFADLDEACAWIEAEIAGPARRTG